MEYVAGRRRVLDIKLNKKIYKVDVPKLGERTDLLEKVNAAETELEKGKIVFNYLEKFGLTQEIMQEMYAEDIQEITEHLFSIKKK